MGLMIMERISMNFRHYRQDRTMLASRISVKVPIKPSTLIFVLTGSVALVIII